MENKEYLLGITGEGHSFIKITPKKDSLTIGSEEIPYNDIVGIVHENQRMDDNLLIIEVSLSGGGIYPRIIPYNFLSGRQSKEVSELIEIIQERVPYEIKFEQIDSPLDNKTDDSVHIIDGIGLKAHEIPEYTENNYREVTGISFYMYSTEVRGNLNGINTFHATDAYIIKTDYRHLFDIGSTHFVVEEGWSEEYVMNYEDSGITYVAKCLLVSANHEGVREERLFVGEYEPW